MDFGFASHQPLGKKNRDPLYGPPGPTHWQARFWSPLLGPKQRKSLNSQGRPPPSHSTLLSRSPPSRFFFVPPFFFAFVAGGSVFPLIQYLRTSCFSIRP